ncbi:hypothetical protein OAC73_01425 [Flavobacteriaceae bacterium]|nr:hypothetical protein [Flavobacteriaceae bacterium]
MNQKRITNQILEQKNYTLNSTLNYLFNISNMKKLFSYLLISSMVVLSSCTNYDDQFDDLNTQINTLKSQIEGFSSLSSGLTALQGTVASLQTAIANIPVTPATDISGLESTQAALTTALTALAADVKALQDTLATAATAADVAALQTALTAAQSDLTDLLAANNVYTPAAGGLVIDSAASLTVAESLGDRLSIVNGDVTITNAVANAMDATKLAAVAAKMGTITGKLTYSHSGTGVTSVSFTNLTSAGSLDFDQDAPISLPELVSTGVVTMTTSSLITSVSLPKLTTVTSLSDGTTNSFDFSGATSIDLSSLVRYSTGTLGITTKSTGTLDLSALTTTSATTGLQAALNLTVRGPKVLTLTAFETGVVDTNAEVVTLPKAVSAPTLDAAKLTELHLHNLQNDLTLTGFNQLETLDVIGSYITNGAAATVAGPRTNDVTLSTATSLTKLTLAGALGDVSISGASNLTDVTTSGGMTSFSLTGATDLTALTLGHGPNASSTLKRSDLIITGATSLVSLTADSINNANTLTIEDNTELTTISLAGLKALATEADLDPAVRIDDNNLQVQSVQIATASTVTPAVAGKVTTDSGITALKAYLDKAIAAADSNVYVFFDNVLEVVKTDGTKVVGTDSTPTVATGLSATNSSVISTVENAGWIFINVAPGVDGIASVKQRQSVVYTIATEGNGYADKALATADVQIVAGGLTKNYVGGTSATQYATVSAMAAAINATDFGTGVKVTASRDAGQVAYQTINYTNPSGTASTVVASAVTDKIYVKLGTASAVFAVSSGTLTANTLADAVAEALNGKVVSGKKYAVSANTGVLKVSRLMTGTTDQDFGRNSSFPAISILTTDTAGYMRWSANASNTSGITSDYNLSVTQNVVSGLRVTFENNSFALALTSANATATLAVADAAITAVTELESGVNHHSDTTLNIPFSLAKDNSGTGSAGPAIDATAWL